MEWDQISVNLAGGLQMVEKPQNLSFFGRRSFVPRPMSEATEIFDTDNEDDVTDDELVPQSSGSVSGLVLHTRASLTSSLAGR